MDWSRPVDLYCERTDPSFWAEPVNALTNVSFLIAAAVAFVQWRRAGANDRPVFALILITATIGIGSFIFHTIATRGAALFDTIPIAVFIYGYLFFALRWFLTLSHAEGATAGQNAPSFEIEAPPSSSFGMLAGKVMRDWRVALSSDFVSLRVTPSIRFTPISRGRGTRACTPPHDGFWGARYAIVEDPDGIAVCIMSAISPDKKSAPPDG